jgi:hypothetical protein
MQAVIYRLYGTPPFRATRQSFDVSTRYKPNPTLKRSHWSLVISRWLVDIDTAQQMNPLECSNPNWQAFQFFFRLKAKGYGLIALLI